MFSDARSRTQINSVLPAKCDLHPMKFRHLLLCIALLPAPALFAQEESIITTEPAVIPERSHDTDEPFTIVEVMPTFPGGDQAMFKHIGTQVKYPEEALENGIQGVVYVTFVVERDGEITNVKMLRGIGGGCDEEALRVLRSMPKWTPGMQDGKAVRVRYNLPFRFRS